MTDTSKYKLPSDPKATQLMLIDCDSMAGWVTKEVLEESGKNCDVLLFYNPHQASIHERFQEINLEGVYLYPNTIINNNNAADFNLAIMVGSLLQDYETFFIVYHNDKGFMEVQKRVQNELIRRDMKHKVLHLKQAKSITDLTSFMKLTDDGEDDAEDESKERGEGDEIETKNGKGVAVPAGMVNKSAAVGSFQLADVAHKCPLHCCRSKDKKMTFGGLYGHMKAKTNSVKVVCAHCSQSYASARTFAQHLKSCANSVKRCSLQYHC